MILRKINALIRGDVIFLQHDRYGKVKCEVVELKSSSVVGMTAVELKTQQLDFGPTIHLHSEDLVEIILG